MSNRLVNQYDGLWEYSYYKAGKWELSLGRWFWLYLDRLRFNISVDPINSMFTLFCYCLGIVLIIDLFLLGKKKLGYIAGFIFLSNAVVSITLSYRFMSPTFGISVLFNVIGAWIVIKHEDKPFISIPLCGLFLSLGMGAYQSNIGCACLIFVAYVMYLLTRTEHTPAQILKLMAKMAAGLVLGALLYIVLLKLHLAVLDTVMSGYNGGNSYSILNSIKKLPHSLSTAFFMFGFYYKNLAFKTTLLPGPVVYGIIYGFIGLCIIVQSIRLFSKNKVRAILFLLCLPAIPVASGATLFIATDAPTSLQMTAPWAMTIPVLLILISTFAENSEKLMEKCLIACTSAMALVVLYGCFYQIQVDQESMLEGQTATVEIAEEVLSSLANEDLLSPDLRYCFLGLPAANPNFATTDIYQMANGYAQFGAWWSDPYCSLNSYQGVFRFLCGSDIHVCTAGEFNELTSLEEVQDMPAFPSGGSIKVVNDIVVVRISE
ncbi:MAG: glucosyltransferase domain-containing protein [Acetatifactor sp.]|nr:glucosyltransferase domain-containing protein [Acetatifactor sp.]